MAEVTIQQAFELASQHHQSGRLSDAEGIYRQILAVEPRHAGTLHYLGVLAHQVGRSDAAIELIRRALAQAPDWPEALSNLGNVLQAKGQFAEAAVACRRALVLAPRFAEAYNNLGNALSAQGQVDEAIVVYRQAVVLRPDYCEAHNNLGTALWAKGRLEEAIAAYRQALALRPDYAAAHNNLGNALRGKGQLEEALVAFREALSLAPDFSEAYSNLGGVLHERGQLDEAIAAFRRALELTPSLPEVHNNLGDVLQAKGCLDEALAAVRDALALRPNYAEAHNNIGGILQAQGRLDEAIVAFGEAIVLKPDFPEAYNNLGNALKDKGQLDEAIAAYRQALALKPALPAARSNLILALHYHPNVDVGAIAEELRRWDQRHGDPLKGYIRRHSNGREAGRRLRIGYVSPDFREHAAGRFLLPLLANHDHQQVEVFAYAQVPVSDALTERLRGHTDAWRSVVRLSDDQMADLIRQDRIDILVDLAMHTAGNRLLVFARKPAPVQVTYLAYAGSSGLSAMDYRLSDPYLDPPGLNDAFYSEETIRLPHSFWCYDPLDGRELAVGPLPVLEKGFITFVSLNNFCKVNEGLLGLWGQILSRVANSRLLLHAQEGSHRQRVLDQLQAAGVGPQRVSFAGKMSMSQYFRLYRGMDIALDTHPYGGGTTSCDALWMGVPVVSLVGKAAVGRGGLSILSNVGLAELVACTGEQYVQLAVGLAKDLPRLTALRAGLRQRMTASPLMDAPSFAHSIEQAYRQMWRTWTATRG